MIVKNITPYGYGMTFISVPLFLEKIKSKKIHTAKLMIMKMRRENV